jgi:hypothetical protein
MPDKYIPQEIEPRWQAQWAADGLYETVEDPDREKYYFLTMLPYPSGDLHIGHWYAMTPSDAARPLQTDERLQRHVSRWALTRSACPPKTPPSKTASTR